MARIRLRTLGGAFAVLALAATPAAGQNRGSSARQQQTQGTAEIPKCSKPLGAIALVDPDNQWWVQYNLTNPEAILRVFVQQSRCFTLVNRGRSMRSRAMEREMAEMGELRAGSNMGAGQVRTADYFLEPNIVSANRNSGGGGVGAAVGGLLGRVGGLAGVVGGMAGGVNVRRGEANVTLSVVNARTTEEQALTEGYARKSDVSFAGGGGAGWWGAFGAAGASGYQNTEIGQVIVLAYLDAYKKLVSEMGGLEAYEAAPAPAPARR